MTTWRKMDCWIDSKKVIVPLGQSAEFKLIENCEPTISTEEFVYIDKFLPLTFSGCIYEIETEYGNGNGKPAE